MPLGDPDTTAELRDLIREAHAAVKDLRQAIGSARALPGSLLADAERKLRDMADAFRAQVEARMVELTQTATGGLPVRILCNTCGAVLTMLADLAKDDEFTFRCTVCGKVKRIRIEDYPA
jgi:hypothetical protein